MKCEYTVKAMFQLLCYYLFSDNSTIIGQETLRKKFVDFFPEFYLAVLEPIDMIHPYYNLESILLTIYKCL